MYKDMYSIGVPGALKEPAWRLNAPLTPVIKFYDCGGVDGHVPGEIGAGGSTPACNSRYQARPAVDPLARDIALSAKVVSA